METLPYLICYALFAVVTVAVIMIVLYLMDNHTLLFGGLIKCEARCDKTVIDAIQQLTKQILSDVGSFGYRVGRQTRKDSDIFIIEGSRANTERSSRVEVTVTIDVKRWSITVEEFAIEEACRVSAKFTALSNCDISIKGRLSNGKAVQR
jgi:predicted acyltransferase (DUF342 family)